MENLSLDMVILGNTVKQYLIAFASLFLATGAAFFIVKAAGTLLKKLSEKTGSAVVQLALKADQKLAPIIYFLPFYYVIHSLNTPAKLRGIVAGVWLIITVVCVIHYAQDVAGLFFREYCKRRKISFSVVNSLNVTVKVALWCFGILFILSNLGVNISTFMAGLGIGGIAVALAAQTFLGDLFNYFTILFDQPFKIGDTVQVGQHAGTVQSIGLKGTRLVSFSGEQIIVSNTDMTKNILKNYQIMNKRRQLMKLGIPYHTSPEKVRLLPDLLRDIISSIPNVEFSRAHFYEFGDSSLNYEVVYFVLSNNYSLFMDRVQQVNFKIIDEFARMGIEFAFPSQSIYLANNPRTENKE